MGILIRSINCKRYVPRGSASMLRVYLCILLMNEFNVCKYMFPYIYCHCNQLQVINQKTHLAFLIRVNYVLCCSYRTRPQFVYLQPLQQIPHNANKVYFFNKKKSFSSIIFSSSTQVIYLCNGYLCVCNRLGFSNSK